MVSTTTKSHAKDNWVPTPHLDLALTQWRTLQNLASKGEVTVDGTKLQIGTVVAVAR